MFPQNPLKVPSHSSIYVKVKLIDSTQYSSYKLVANATCIQSIVLRNLLNFFMCIVLKLVITFFPFTISNNREKAKLFNSQMSEYLVNYVLKIL